MNHTINPRLPRARSILGCLLIGITSPLASQAAVTVNSSFSLDTNTNLFTYSYTVENLGPSELGLVSIPTSAAANISNVVTPEGFILTFDPFLGFINLFEDSDLFTEQSFAVGTTTPAFQFTSVLAPGTATYTAFDTAGDEFTGAAISPIPEPSTLLFTGVALFAASARRNRQTMTN